jgi:phytoene dehydrogenase-like protein
VSAAVNLARPSAPLQVAGGWEQHAEGFADAMVEQRPMHLDLSLDQLAFLRPTRRLAGHTVPGAERLLTCGASTAPVGGIAGSSGKAAPLALLGRS